MKQTRHPDNAAKDAESSEFLSSLKKGLLFGVVLMVLILPPLHLARKKAPEQPVATAPQQQAPAQRPGAAAPEAASPPLPGVQLADFRGEDPSPDARQVADWVVHSRDNKQSAFVLVDKKDARVYVFSPDGKLQDSAPALLGSARGDDSFPGIGDKPLAAIQPYEKTTPAGRYVAEIGRNANNEDVVWVDYDAAVSMHRIRPLVAQERRLERLATLTIDDNRISFGCINLPVSFYENVLQPTVQKQGAIVYVLPETKTAQQVFGAYDVSAAMQQTSTRPAGKRNDPLQRVAHQAGS
jgi:hypothetical protein